MSTPDISVLLVNYNGRGLLPGCLSAVRAALGARSAEIIVVDNASRDGSVAYLSGLGDIRVVASPVNEGFARAMNRAMALATGARMLWLNPDCLLGPGSLAAAIAALDGLDAPALLGPRLLDEDGRTQPSALAWTVPSRAVLHVLGARGWLRLPGARAAAARVSEALPAGAVREYLATSAAKPRSREVDWLTGACLLMSGETARRVGPLDERFFIYCEDEAWCRKAAALGIRRVWWPDWVARHSAHGTWDGSPYIECHYYRSQLIYHRNYDSRGAWIVAVALGSHAFIRGLAEAVRALTGARDARLRRDLWFRLARWMLLGGPEPCGTAPPPAWPLGAGESSVAG